MQEASKRYPDDTYEKRLLCYERGDRGEVLEHFFKGQVCERNES
jgi:hypothetical protein